MFPFYAAQLYIGIHKLDMTPRPSNSMFYISITVTILSSALYHFSQRSTPQNANPAAALLVTYAVAMILTTGPAIFCSGERWTAGRVPATELGELPIGVLDRWPGDRLSAGVPLGLEHRFGGRPRERGGLAHTGSGCVAVLQGSAGLGQLGGHPRLPCGAGVAQLEKMRA